MSLSLADLRRQYYGGGSDAEYDFLQEAYDAGVTAADLLGLLTGDTPLPVAVFDESLATNDIITSKVTGDTQQRFVVNADGKLEWGPGNAALDAANNLSRYNGNTMKLGGNFSAGFNIKAYVDTATQVQIGDTGSGAGVLLGTTGDTNIYRSAAGRLATSGEILLAVNNKALKGLNSVATVVDLLVLDASNVEVIGGSGVNQIKIAPSLLGIGSNNDLMLKRIAAGQMRFSGSDSDVNAFRLAIGSYAGGTAVGGTISYGTGAPVNANGANGDIYLRVDGGALSTIYQRRAGVWVGIV